MMKKQSEPEVPDRHSTSDGGATALEFSVIVTCLNEESTIDEFCRRLLKTMDQIGLPYEVILVNDGSTDHTGEKLRRIFEIDARIILLDLQDNAGQWAAISAGLSAARGKHFVFADSDLEVSPEDLLALYKSFRLGADIVGGFRQNRGDPKWRRALSWAGNLSLRMLLGIRSRDIGCGLKIIHGNLVRSLSLDPHLPFCPLSMFILARRTADVPIQHAPRQNGCSGWTFGLLVRHYGQSLLAYYVPYRRAIRVAVWAGAVASSVWFAISLCRAITRMPPASRLFLVGGMTLAAMTAVAWLLHKGIEDTVRPRPQPFYVIAKEYRH